MTNLNSDQNLIKILVRKFLIEIEKIWAIKVFKHLRLMSIETEFSIKYIFVQ